MGYLWVGPPAVRNAGIDAHTGTVSTAVLFLGPGSGMCIGGERPGFVKWSGNGPGYKPLSRCTFWRRGDGTDLYIRSQLPRIIRGRSVHAANLSSSGFCDRLKRYISSNTYSTRNIFVAEFVNTRAGWGYNHETIGDRRRNRYRPRPGCRRCLRHRRV